MKKVLVFLLAILSSTVLLAQSESGEHFVPITPDDFGGMGMMVNTVIVIDGEEQYNPNLEIAAFDVVTGECRGTKYPPRTLPNGRIYYALSVNGVVGEYYTYKLYDHENDVEFDYEVDFTDENYPQLSFEVNGTYGALRTPWEVHFVSSSNGFTKDITPYSGDGGSYLIASPIGEVAVTAVENLTSNEFDLYYFDQEQELEWINYNQGANADPGFTTLVAGKGYLYANSGDGTNNVVTLTFNGDAYSGEGTFPLDYDANAELKGWNLMGNPFAVTAHVDRAFYLMNETGDDYISYDANATIEAMEGCFVVAEAEGESVTFSPAETGKSANLALNLSNGRNVVDRAILSFNEGRTLPKFMLNENHTKLFIPVDGKDFAVVGAENQGEMPVSFKAEKNGVYNISINAENVAFDYLHLIDNKTGADVDLLETPSYTFKATTNDYASRFRLVFGITTDINDVNVNNFGFYNNGNIVINNEGAAILNIVDVLGRTISSQSINGSQNVSLNAKAGVYTLQLIQGENVKTQKIVVE